MRSFYRAKQAIALDCQQQAQKGSPSVIWQAETKTNIDLTSDLADNQILAVDKDIKQRSLKTLRV
jgi:hypothetical protein